MSESVRRSSRRPKTKTSVFNVNDIVEITRNGVIVEGRLAYKLTVGPSPNPRWLVKFDGEPWKDEELYEHVFGKVLRRAEDNESSRASPNTSRNKPKPSRSNSNNKSASNNSKSSSTTSSSEGEDKQGKNKNKKSVTFPETSEGESSSQNAGGESKSALAAAREQRIKRRQAKSQDDEGNNGVGVKRTRQGPIKNSNAANKKVHRRSTDDEVIKVPMLTGTLYLYRGLQRRAEFVRKY